LRKSNHIKKSFASEFDFKWILEKLRPYYVKNKENKECLNLDDLAFFDDFKDY
jgi:hypothetical protein